MFNIKKLFSIKKVWVKKFVSFIDFLKNYKYIRDRPMIFFPNSAKMFKLGFTIQLPIFREKIKNTKCFVVEGGTSWFSIFFISKKNNVVFFQDFFKKIFTQMNTLIYEFL